MGRTSEDHGGLNGSLFRDGLPTRRRQKAVHSTQDGYVHADGRQVRPPHQSNAKSQLIAEYLKLFLMVTRSGIYIDGFAGPQKPPFEEAWTARRVLALEPKWLRAFYLCELGDSLTQVQRLARQHHDPPDRQVVVLQGDFNQQYRTAISSRFIKRGTAVFVLLDQRSTECHWATVKALAARAGRMKVEMLYFLGTGWLHRALSETRTPEGLQRLRNWWGSDGWTGLMGLPQRDLPGVMAHRFADELGYRYVQPFAIYQDESNERALFHLIHASDHPEALPFMRRAYRKVVGLAKGEEDPRQPRLFEDP